MIRDSERLFYCDSCGFVTRWFLWPDRAVWQSIVVPSCFSCGSTYGACRSEDTQAAVRGRVRIDTYMKGDADEALKAEIVLLRESLNKIGG